MYNITTASAVAIIRAYTMIYTIAAEPQTRKRNFESFLCVLKI